MNENDTPRPASMQASGLPGTARRPEPIVQVNNLCKDYVTRGFTNGSSSVFHAVNNVSFDVPIKLGDDLLRRHGRHGNLWILGLQRFNHLRKQLC